MDGHESLRWDVAAYALGVLDHREVERYELHLAECSACAAELEFLLPASRLLADVDPNDIQSVEDSRLVDRLLDAVRIDRQRARRRHRITVGIGTAVAAALAGFAVLGGVTWLDSFPTDNVAGSPFETVSPEADPPDDLELGPGEPISVTDPDTGVSVEALLTGTDWGTQVSITLSEVTGPRECQLLVVHRDGTEEVVGSWRVPATGYGTEERPEPLRLRLATAADRSDIQQLRIRELAEDGSVSAVLAVVPV
ncbi:MAG TPA: zf-HC2 domain-containing protein [Natronosporangium sp.]